MDKCLRCKEKLSAGLGFCARCGKDVSIPDAYSMSVNNVEVIRLELQNFKAEMQEQMNFLINRMQGNENDVFKHDKDDLVNLKPNSWSMLFKNGVKTDTGIIVDFNMENIGAVVTRNKDGTMKLEEKFIAAKVKHKQGYRSPIKKGDMVVDRFEILNK